MTPGACPPLAFHTQFLQLKSRLSLLSAGRVRRLCARCISTDKGATGVVVVIHVDGDAGGESGHVVLGDLAAQHRGVLLLRIYRGYRECLPVLLCKGGIHDLAVLVLLLLEPLVIFIGGVAAGGSWLREHIGKSCASQHQHSKDTQYNDGGTGVSAASALLELRIGQFAGDDWRRRRRQVLLLEGRFNGRWDSLGWIKWRRNGLRRILGHGGLLVTGKWPPSNDSGPRAYFPGSPSIKTQPPFCTVVQSTQKVPGVPMNWSAAKVAPRFGLK